VIGILYLLLSLWLIPLGFTLFNVWTWTRGRLTRATQKRAISLLVPARNEERNIGELLESALNAEDGVLTFAELLVYDDASNDRTAELVLAWAERDPRVRLLSAKSLPEGWVGKPYACQQLLEAATGQYLLFVDADVRLKSQALSRLFSLIDEGLGVPIVTAVPQQIAKSPLEILILPLLHLTYTSWLPLNWANRQKDTRTVAACGQILFTSKPSLLSMGGFASVRAELVDDVALCRRARELGHEALFVDGFEIASCRMYRNAREVWAGFSKNIYLGLRTPRALALALALYLSAFVLPYAYSVFCLMRPGGTWSALLAPESLPLPLQLAALGIIGNIVLRSVLACRYRHSILSVLLHPLSVILLVVISINSFIWSKRGRIHWAGRIYPEPRGFASK
jgi:chlorobactene glucosyltransferase